MRKISLVVVAILLLLGVQKSQAQSITLTSPSGGGMYHFGDTVHIAWTTSHSPGDSLVPIQIGFRDSRYDPNLAYGEVSIVGSMPNTHHYDFVIPGSFGYLSEGVLGGDSVYSIVLYYYMGGMSDSFAQSVPFSIAPLFPADTAMHPSFSVSDTLLCHSGTIHFTYTGTCADSTNTVISWSIYGGSGSTYTPDTVMGRNMNVAFTPIAWMLSDNVLVEVRITDTISGAWRSYSRRVRIDTVLAEISTLAWSSFMSTNADTVTICPADSVEVHAGTAEATFVPSWSWNGGLSGGAFTLPTSGRYGWNIVTITDGYGCYAKDSVYILLDTMCTGLGRVIHTNIQIVDDTICQGSYGLIDNITTSVPMTHTSYHWDFSPLVDFYSRYWDYPADVFGIGFINAGTGWVKLTIYDSLTGLSSTDSQMITVLPAPHVLALTTDTFLNCSGTVLLNATTDLTTSHIEWHWFEGGMRDTMSYGNSLLADYAPEYYAIIAVDSNGCTSSTHYTFVDTAVIVYDTTSVSPHTFYGFDSTLYSFATFSYLDSFLITGAKVHTHDTGRLNTWIMNVISQTITTRTIRNHCDSSIVSTLTFAPVFDTSGGWLVYDSVHHRWNDTTTCLTSINYTTTRDTLSTSIAGITYTPVTDTVGTAVRVDTIIVTTHSHDSTHCVSYLSGVYNFCTGDTTLPHLDSAIYHTISIGTWTTTTTHIGDTIWCFSDTVYFHPRVFARMDSVILTSSTYLKNDTTVSTAGVYSQIVRHDAGVRNVRRNDSLINDTTHMYIRSLCTGDTTSHFINAFVDTVHGSSYIDSVHYYTFDTTWCHHDSTFTFVDVPYLDTLSVSYNHLVLHDTSGGVATSDSFVVGNWHIWPAHRIDTNLLIINHCTSDTIFNNIVGHSTHHDPSYYYDDTSAHYYDTVVLTGLNVATVCTLPFYVYPNPTSDFLVVSTSEECKVGVFDINGKEIPCSTENVKEGIKVFVGELPAGTYMLRIQTRTKNCSAHFVKE